MSITPSMADIQWRKSSYSGDTGGECVECAPIGDIAWRKSSYSGNSGGECVEVAELASGVAVRDSKDADGPHLVFPVGVFSRLVQTVARDNGRIPPLR